MCELVGGYALTADALGEPSVPAARLPAYDAAKASQRSTPVALGVLAPSHAYRRSPLTVVLGASAPQRPIRSLRDLSGIRLGCENDTLSCAILMRYGGGRLAAQTTHLVPGSGVLELLQKGAYQATLIELSRFDAYRAAHPHSDLRATGYYHSLAFNIGFVALKRNHRLLRKVDAVIERMLASGEIEAMARRAGLTYVAPRAPLAQARIPAAALSGD